jgi:hypothetical protein
VEGIAAQMVVFDQEKVKWTEKLKLKKVVLSGAGAWMTDNLLEALQLTNQ